MSRSISKKKRFEVFERDEFTCQYCGRNPVDQDIVLEVDHCHSVKNGGSNDIDNLITSCFDCNRGKSAKTVILNKENKLQEIKEEEEKIQNRLEQIKYIKKIKEKIRKAKKEIEENDYLFVSEILDGYSNEFINNIKIRVKTQHTKYGINLDTLEDCVDIAYNKFCNNEFYTNDFVKYFYGVLRNKLK